MTAWDVIDQTLKRSGMWDAQTNHERGGQDFARNIGQAVSPGCRAGAHRSELDLYRDTEFTAAQATSDRASASRGLCGAGHC
jgi:hypothetical protein